MPASARAAVRSATPTIDDWNWVLGINLWGPIHGCHVFAPILREAGYGGIINVASAAASPRLPAWRAYNVSKAGVLSLSETLAAELAGTGVNVTVLCPTFVKTNIVETGRISDKSTEMADRLMRLDRVLARTGGPHLPRHPRSWRPLLHAAARRPNRLGDQAFHSDGVHPRRRSHHADDLEHPVLLTPQPRRISWRSTWTRCWRRSRTGSGPWPTSTGTRPGAETITDEFTAEAEGLHGRPVLDRERRRPRLRGDGQEGADADHRRDLPLLPRRGAAARQRRTRADEALGHARRRRDARAERQHPAGHRVAGHATPTTCRCRCSARSSRCSRSPSTARC